MRSWQENILLINDAVAKIPYIEPRTSKNLLHLLLLFNSFENIEMGFNDHPRNIFYRNYSLDLIYYEKTFIFFKERYVNGDKTNKRFEDLFGRDNRVINNSNRIKENVSGYLLDEQVSDENKLYTCIEISYRFRNNIFHGTKAVFELDCYNDCYDVIIELFSNILQHSQRKRGWRGNWKS